MSSDAVLRIPSIKYILYLFLLYSYKVLSLSLYLSLSNTRILKRQKGRRAKYVKHLNELELKNCQYPYIIYLISYINIYIYRIRPLYKTLQCCSATKYLFWIIGTIALQHYSTIAQQHYSANDFVGNMGYKGHEGTPVAACKYQRGLERSGERECVFIEG